MDPHTQPEPTVITPASPAAPQQAPYVAPVPAPPTIIPEQTPQPPLPPQPQPPQPPMPPQPLQPPFPPAPPQATQLPQYPLPPQPLEYPVPKKSHKIRKTILILFILFVAFCVIGYFMPGSSNNNNQSGTPPSSTPDESTPDAATEPDTETAADLTKVINDYIAAWRSNPAAAASYLDLPALKADPTCENSCTDADITDPEKLKYVASDTKIEQVKASSENTVKVYIGATDNSNAKGGYVYTLKKNGTSWKITFIDLFFE